MLLNRVMLDLAVDTLSVVVNVARDLVLSSCYLLMYNAHTLFSITSLSVYPSTARIFIRNMASFLPNSNSKL